jgi:hypothetical protein
MVVIRIKEKDDGEISKKICNDDIKIIKNLKFCKLLNSDLDEKIEKKIEFLINDKSRSSVEYDNSDDEYTIFGLLQDGNNYDRRESPSFKPKTWNLSKQSSISNINTNTNTNTNRRKKQ